jgi:hypothetical protein
VTPDSPPDLDKSLLAIRQSVVVTSSAAVYLPPDALRFYLRLVYKSEGDVPDPKQTDLIDWLDSSSDRHCG